MCMHAYVYTCVHMCAMVCLKIRGQLLVVLSSCLVGSRGPTQVVRPVQKHLSLLSYLSSSQGLPLTHSPGSDCL